MRSRMGRVAELLSADQDRLSARAWPREYTADRRFFFSGRSGPATAPAGDQSLHRAHGLRHHRCGKQFTAFNRENTVQLTVDGDTVFPDASFVLQQDGEPFRYFLEMDTGSESIVSPKKSADSIERKIRIYEAFQDAHPQTRFRVLFVSARNSAQRLGHVLDVAGRIARDPNRTVFYCITLKQYLANKFPVTSPIFIDHRRGRQSLVPDIGLAKLRSNALSRRPAFDPTLLSVKGA